MILYTKGLFRNNSPVQVSKPHSSDDKASFFNFFPMAMAKF